MFYYMKNGGYTKLMDVKPVSEKLKGVNLGGWLVLERWITPSLFKGTSAQDEFTFMQQPGATERVGKHRREFMREADFQWLAKQGVNAVRIPVGYWIFDGDEPFTEYISHLDFAMEMAEKYKLKVLLCMHAAPGSQNGNDHSGRIGNADWFGSARHREKTIEILIRLAVHYKNSPSLWGIELLNEPSLGPARYFILTNFYRNAYRALSSVVNPGTYIIFSDSFAPWLFTGAIRPKEEVPVAIDIHWYQFGLTNVNAYFAKLKRRPRVVSWLERCQPVIVGEWSGMLSHETLAGLPKSEQEELEKRHLGEQMKAYEDAKGWFYWTYKTEEGGIWSFRDQVEKGNLLLRS